MNGIEAHMTIAKLQNFPTNASELISLMEHRIKAKGTVQLHDFEKQNGEIVTWQSYIESKISWYYRDTGCLIWNETSPQCGHGLVQRPLRFIDFELIQANSLQAHRLVWSVVNQRPLVDVYPFIVRHLCGNPACCQPSHLSIGTEYENRVDMKLHDLGLTFAPTLNRNP